VNTSFSKHAVAELIGAFHSGRGSRSSIGGAACVWFTASTPFANAAITIARLLTDTVFDIRHEPRSVRLVFGGSKGSGSFTPLIVRRIQRKKMTAGDDRTIAARSKIADSSTGP
jgi:hypothetical protein